MATEIGNSLSQVETQQTQNTAQKPAQSTGLVRKLRTLLHMNSSGEPKEIKLKPVSLKLDREKVKQLQQTDPTQA